MPVGGVDMSRAHAHSPRMDSLVLDDLPSARLTTAEALVVDLLVAHRLLGAIEVVPPGYLWARPPLDSLEDKGFLSWSFYAEENFSIACSPCLLSSPVVSHIGARLARGTARPVSTTAHPRV